MPSSTKQFQPSLNKKFFSGLLFGLGMSLSIAIVSLGVYLVLAAVPGTVNPTGAPPGDDVSWDPLHVDPVNSRVGIGTTQPQGLLDINSGTSDTSALFVRADPAVDGRGGIIYHQDNTYAWQEIAQGTASPTGFLTFHFINRITPQTKIKSNVMVLTGQGNIGVGTASPNDKGSGSYLDAKDIYLRDAGRWASTPSCIVEHGTVSTSPHSVACPTDRYVVSGYCTGTNEHLTGITPSTPTHPGGSVTCTMSDPFLSDSQVHPHAVCCK